MLMTLEDYRQNYFSEVSRPSLRALRDRCKRGSIAGAVKQGKYWYIQTAVESLAPVKPRQHQLTGNPRLDRIIRG